VRSVSSVALQLLRGLEEILMKGATHNLVVRTRTDVALYVLNHKRGHLRDLENSFKVTLAVIADPTVSGQQSFVIDRGEQVHTLEAAKALLAAQVAAFPAQSEEAFEEDEPSDIEVESEVETEESEGLTGDLAAGETGGEAEADGNKRKRRRRRRGRPGEPREGEPAHEANDLAPEAVAATGAIAGEGADEDETDEQPGQIRSDQAPGGERRPRRRGRRGGRRRRGGTEDGLAGSITDELRPASAPEAASAVADFDGVSQSGPAAPGIQSEPVAPPPEPQYADRSQPEATRASAETETAQEAERAARRRSTVREKVRFLADAQPDTAEPANRGQPAPTPAPDSARQPDTGATHDTQPRRAGWWSRRFGNGE
jgi:ribonuclease E